MDNYFHSQNLVERLNKETCSPYIYVVHKLTFFIHKYLYIYDTFLETKIDYINTLSDKT